jgi:TolB-like protein/DNA-binding winged helix-turn-helix (wHTH) protein
MFLFLVEHKGSVVDKERLIAAVWPGSLVEDNNLSQSISNLRHLFGEKPGAHRFIVTVPGRGYRFVAEVKTREANGAIAPQKLSANKLVEEATKRVASVSQAEQPRPIRRLRRWSVPIAAALAFSVAVAILWSRQRHEASTLPAKSIAVMPFKNLSEGNESAYFAEGIQDEILTRLSKIAELKVISRTSTQHYKSAPENLPDIARELGVANILEGSVQKSGDAVRVNVQLIKATNDSHLWAETFDRKLTDTFSVESDVAKAIAEQLRAKLTGREEEIIAAKPTNNSEA